MKKIAVFGATGGTGQELTSQALAAGYQLKALVRNPNRMSITGDQLQLTIGDVLNQDKVNDCIAGCDAVICSLGSTYKGPSDTTSVGTQNIIKAMNKYQIHRLLVVSSLGVGDSKDQISTAFKLVASTILRKVMIDKEQQEKIVMASKLKWTIVRPSGLTNGPKTNNYIVGTGKDIMAKRVSRANVADFLLKILGKDQYVQEAVAIT